ncbi:MAG: tRNA (N(6)-L-threonylcarbamoyladenosine(37)-C(2))-methylthiotransferase MtaB [Coriobacteriia bacterium]|nr:tRNA (N(6)-L-threonylcarbamoyladenosine(37)-C(2))-methylthiotransferase MtaB [Coriobacteriia bacterium]
MSEVRRLAVAFRTLGCKVNRVESESIAAELLGQGCEVVGEDQAAVVVVNTCTVTGEADAKARKAVRRALGAAGEPVVVVTGCLAALDREALLALGERVVVEADKERVAARVAEALGGGAVVSGAPESGTRHVRAGEGFRTRAMVKVQDGCDNFCGYCIVPHARGVPRSVAADVVVAEVTALADAGVREVVLTGINIGRYRDGATDLPGLMSRLVSTGIARLRLSSLEPPDVTTELLAVMAAHADVVCPHLHLPLQSGSDSVLSAMGRRYTAAEYAKRVAAARAWVPGLAVTTDVISGLPGETDADAEETLRLCEEIGFARLHVFRYSPRAGTPAAERNDQVPAPVKAARAEALRGLDARLRDAHEASRAGDRAEILVERVEGDVAEGTTRDYLRVRVPADCASPGDLIEVVLGEEHLTTEDDAS